MVAALQMAMMRDFVIVQTCQNVVSSIDDLRTMDGHHGTSFVGRIEGTEFGAVFRSASSCYQAMGNSVLIC
jgi:hypothetical protein